MGHPQPPTPMEVDNETAIGLLKITMKQKRSKASDMRFYWVRDRVKQNQFLIYWRPGANNVGDYVSKHHYPAHHQTMRPKVFVNLVCQNPFSSTENCLQRLSICLQRGGDNPIIVGYDSNCSHKTCGTSKPTFSSPKDYLPSFTSISKIYNSYS